MRKISAQCNPHHDAIRTIKRATMQSAQCSPHDAIRTYHPHDTICTMQSARCNLHNAICTIQSALQFNPHNAICMMKFAQCVGQRPKGPTFKAQRSVDQANGQFIPQDAIPCDNALAKGQKNNPAKVPAQGQKHLRWKLQWRLQRSVDQGNGQFVQKYDKIQTRTRTEKLRHSLWGGVGYSTYIVSRAPITC